MDTEKNCVGAGEAHGGDLPIRNHARTNEAGGVDYPIELRRKLGGRGRLFVVG
jgi:hypothetical protein